MAAQIKAEILLRAGGLSHREGRGGTRGEAEKAAPAKVDTEGCERV